MDPNPENNIILTQSEGLMLSLIHIYSAGKALFSIPDNGLLCLFYGNGDRHFAVCHRLDDTLSLIHISYFVSSQILQVI